VNAPHHPAHANRPPDWRARQAYVDAAAGRLRPPRWATRAQRWLTLQLQGRTGTLNEALRAILRDPSTQEFRQIVDLYCHRDRAAKLEALLLARVPWPILQTTYCYTYVPIYAELFFDVVARLGDATYIVDYAIRPEASVGPPATAKRRVATKLFGFFCGADALEDLYQFGQRPATAEYFGHPVDFAQRAAAIAQVDAVADWVLTAGKSPPPQKIKAQMQSIVEVLASVCRRSYPRNASAQALRNAVLRSGDRLQPSTAESPNLPN